MPSDAWTASEYVAGGRADPEDRSTGISDCQKGGCLFDHCGCAGRCRSGDYRKGRDERDGQEDSEDYAGALIQKSFLSKKSPWSSLQYPPKCRAADLQSFCSSGAIVMFLL